MGTRVKKKKRRLKWQFRFLRNIFLFLVAIIIILASTYFILFKEDVDKIIESYNELILNDEFTNDINTRTNSYTIAVLGIDEDMVYGRTDSINLITVNPKKNTMKIYNVPRDSYINYSCIDNSSDKITNAHAYGGVDCTLDALSNLFDVEIDFYVKMTFEGFLSIIDSLGTIETDIPDFLNGDQWCEQTANRIDLICFSEFGQQEVTSEQALAIARSRQYSSDLDRGILQTQIMKDTMNEIMSIRDLNELNEIIVNTDGHFETNIQVNQMIFIAYNYYKFNKSDQVIEKIQLPGEAVSDYYGEYSGWGSYFIVDIVNMDIIKAEIKEDLK